MARTRGANSKARPAKDMRQRAWAQMRYRGKFTMADIMETTGIGKDNLKKYLRALVKAGYVREVKPKKNGVSMGYAVYRLVTDRNTGPKHPLAWKNGQVYDQNNGETYGEADNRLDPGPTSPGRTETTGLVSGS